MAASAEFSDRFTQWLISLFRRRPLMTIDEALKSPLRRCLNTYHVVFLGIASMAGAGIYVLTGKLIGQNAGAATCLSYLIGGVSAIFTALCYAEFATRVPRAGSVYVFTFLTLGELPAFIIGWTTISDAIVSIAAVAKAFSGTIDLITNHAITNWTEDHVGILTTSPTSTLAPTYDFLAAGLIIVLSIIVATGAKSSMTFNAVITALQMGCLAIIIVGCFVYGSADSFSTAHGGFAPNGFDGIVSGATIAVFAYGGFDAIIYASEEMIDPVRTIPRAMLIIVVTIMIVYFSASLGLAFLVPRELIDFRSPFVAGFQNLGVIWLVVISAIGTLLATGVSKVAMMYTVPRTFYAIGDDGLIFRCFAHVEKRTQVPQFGLLFGGCIAVVLALFLNIQTLAEFVSLGYIFSYFAIGADLLVLRYLLTSSTDEIMETRSVSDSRNGVENDDDDRCLLRIRERFRGIKEKYPLIQRRELFIILLFCHVMLTFVFAGMLDIMMISHVAMIWIAVGIVFVGWMGTVIGLSMFEPSYSTASYQTPFMPMAPVLTMLINAILILRLTPITWLRFAIWIAIGFLIYFTYGRKHSIAREGNTSYSNLEDSKISDKNKQDTSYGTNTVN